MTTTAPPPPTLTIDRAAYLALFPHLDPATADSAEIDAALEQTYAYFGRSYGGSEPALQTVVGNGVDRGALVFSGVPDLPPPVGTLSDQGSDGLAAMLGWLKSQVTGEVTQTTVLNIQSNHQEFKRQAEAAEANRKEAAASAEKAAKATSDAKVAEIAQLIATIIGAIIALAVAVVFGGFVLGAIAAAAIVMVILDVSTMIMKETGATRKDASGKDVPLDISIGGMVAMSFDEDVRRGRIVIVRQDANGDFVDAKGNVIPDPRPNLGPFQVAYTEQEYQTAVMAASITISIVLALVMLAGGVAGVAGGANAGARASRVLDKLNDILGTKASMGKFEAITSGVEAVSTVVEGTTTGASAGVTINLAGENLHLANLKAAKKFIQSMLDSVAQHSTVMQDMFKKLIEELDQAIAMVAKSIGATSDTQQHIAKNMA